MTQNAMKKMYQLLLTEPHAPTVCAQLERIAREALAEHAMRETQRLGQEIEQEPVAHLWECIGKWSAYLVNNGEQADCAPPSWLVDAVNNATTPPQRTEKKMVMWPCLIDTADFSKGIVTVVMQCEDYKVSAGTHYLSTTPPKETK
jgi:hypothetical protein